MESRAETIPAVMKSRMSSTLLMAYSLVQSVMFRAFSSSPRLMALKFRLLSETNFVEKGGIPLTTFSYDTDLVPAFALA